MGSIESNLKLLDEQLHLVLSDKAQLQNQLQATELELSILRKERYILELEAQRKRAKDWQTLQTIKSKLAKANQKRDLLIALAQQFEP